MEKSYDVIARWEAVRTKLLAEIEDIDNNTEWREVEPRWWLQMMEVQRAAREK